ncbi:hypothetical protein Q3G72_011066 [Acer saccharum]|nr:hypothetical protein Q3G72_011066 [Acer saccharum]
MEEEEEEEEEEQGWTSGHLVEQLKEIPVRKGDPIKVVKIGGALNHEVKENLEEVDKLMKAKFIRESHYPEWIANMVMVTKSNGKWRMCLDYTDLNRACPKDSLPLPKIDQLINSTASNKLLSFMDAFSSPPLLVKPLSGEELQLYLAVSKTATSGALVKECSDGVQRPIYYMSRALTKSEKKYTLLKKLAYTLVTTARKLRPYFQAHTVAIVTDQPLRQLLQRPDVSGRLVLWALELT